MSCRGHEGPTGTAGPLPAMKPMCCCDRNRDALPASPQRPRAATAPSRTFPDPIGSGTARGAAPGPCVARRSHRAAPDCRDCLTSPASPPPRTDAGWVNTSAPRHSGPGSRPAVALRGERPRKDCGIAEGNSHACHRLVPARQSAQTRTAARTVDAYEVYGKGSTQVRALDEMKTSPDRASEGTLIGLLLGLFLGWARSHARYGTKDWTSSPSRGRRSASSSCWPGWPACSPRCCRAAEPRSWTSCARCTRSEAGGAGAPGVR